MKDGTVQVTCLAKEGTGKATLTIGYGSNDVGMLRERDSGFGIYGVEGMHVIYLSSITYPENEFYSLIELF